METVKKLSAEEVKDLESSVTVPYRVEGVPLLSPGTWNDLEWTSSEIRRAVENTSFEEQRDRGDEEPPNNALYADHSDRSIQAYVGRVEDIRMENGEAVGDVVVSDKQTAVNLEFGAQFGISPKADGLVDQSGKMQDFRFENFSLVINPAVKTTWLNEDITEVLQDMDIHNPEYRGVSEGEWSSPNLEDFVGHSNWEDLTNREKMAVSKHFLVSKSGFPPETYTDLALPVVEPNGDLNRAALQQAKSRVSQVSGIEEDEIERVEKLTDNLANGNFEDADFGDQDTVFMQDWTVHRPDWSDKADQEWNKPDLEDFTDGDSDWEDLSSDRKSSIGDHFFGSSTGFPAESYGDMALPVVEPDGTLNLNALANAKARAGQVEGMSGDEVEKVRTMITNIANEEFEDADFEPVENQEEVDYMFEEDDKVKWSSAGGQAMGVVRDRTKDECYDAAIDGDVKVCGERDSPAYLIQIFDGDEGELEDTMVGHKQDTLSEASFELNDSMVKNPMTEEEQQEPEEGADESVEEESVENSEDYVTREKLEEFREELLEDISELAEDGDDGEEDEDGGDEVEESEGEVGEELSEFEEFRQENPELSLSEAAEKFEEESRDVSDKLEEMQEQFESKIDELESKLESKDEEVEELSEKVSNPQRATQASEDGEDLEEKVSELSDEELHAAVFKQMESQTGPRVGKEVMFE